MVLSCSNSNTLVAPEAFKDILRDNPHGVIKFKVFKRPPEEKKPEEEKRNSIDKSPDGRYERSAYGNSISQWAHWLSNHPTFSKFIVFVILLNAIILGQEVWFLLSRQIFRIILETTAPKQFQLFPSLTVWFVGIQTEYDEVENWEAMQVLVRVLSEIVFVWDRDVDSRFSVTF